MEVQLVIRDTLPNFEGWLKSYTTARLGAYNPLHPTGPDTGIASEYFGWDWEKAVYVSHHFAPVRNGSVAFRIRVTEAERLEVLAVTHLTQGAESQDERRERQTELDAYLTEFVRAIRMKWEPVNLTVTRAQRKAHKQDDLAKVEVAVRLHDIEGHTWAEAADYLGIGERQLQRLRRKHRPDTIRHAQANVR